MPNKSRKRRKSKYLKGVVDEELAIATLASKVVVGANFDSTVSEKTRVSSLEASYAIRGLTSASDDGPIMIGIAHSDYTDTEIEEYIENLGSWDQGNKVAQEIGKRLIRVIGKFESRSDALEAVTLNDGLPIKTRLNWTLITGQTLKAWAYNLGSSPLSTTVPDISINGHVNLWV